ncbi:MAG: hypothetical protein SOI13_04355 [Bifidobacterium mongoliense]|jgi:hypothetical protein|uniref:hypothetical protein n=1 Tax=Bifidobacterium mongoliense TaxID=518643 RepID=UPI002F351D14
MDSTVIPDIITDPASFNADAAFWIHAAQAAIRRYCGWHVTPNVRLTGFLNTRGGTVLHLPARHVTSINALTARGGRSLQYAYDPDTGLVEILSGVLPVGIGSVSYDIEAGYDECPDVQGVLINAAKRAASAPAGMVTSQSANGASASYDVVTLMRDEYAKLNPYRLGGMP